METSNFTIRTEVSGDGKKWTEVPARANYMPIDNTGWVGKVVIKPRRVRIEHVPWYLRLLAWVARVIRKGV